MNDIIPAIIPKSFYDLNEKLSIVSGLVSIVQIDILDGKFTSGKSWPYINNLDPDFVKIIREEEAFPFSEDLEFEVDLMIERPEIHIQEWITAGAKRIIPHIEAFSNENKALEFVNDFNNQFGGDGSFLVTELGMAIGIDTPNETLEAIIPHIDFIQCMGIGTIGAQGLPFDDRVLNKIENLKSKYPDVIISVDGGVNKDSAKKLLNAGTDRFVVGSAIFNSSDILATIEELENL